MAVEKRIGGFAIAINLALSILAVPAGAQEPAGNLKIGFIYLTPAKDAGWTQAHERGRQALATIPGVETDYVDSISEEGYGAYAEMAIKHLVDSGHNVIFATSFGYIEAVRRVSPSYPNVIFMHCSGDWRSKNVGTYFGKIYQSRYLTGLVAGAMTRSNIVGYVAAYPIPEVIRGINAFTIGVREANPNARVHVRWVKSWHNPEKEKDLANELVDLKADVLAQHLDSPAVQITAEKRGVYGIGYNRDMSQFAPKASLTAAVWNWAPLYQHIASQIQEGKWKSEAIWWGMEKGVVDIAPPGPQVPKATKALVEKRKREIAAGSRHVFAGPLKDQKGTLRLAKGVTATDEELWIINWFVDGVVGSTNP